MPIDRPSDTGQHFRTRERRNAAQAREGKVSPKGGDAGRQDDSVSPVAKRASSPCIFGSGSRTPLSRSGAVRFVLGLPFGQTVSPEGLFSPLRDASPTRRASLSVSPRSAAGPRRRRARLRPSVPVWRSGTGSPCHRTPGQRRKRLAEAVCDDDTPGRSRDQKP